MHSFLIQNFNLKNQNSPDVLVVETETSIGIEEVRQIQVFLSRKPLGQKNTIYIRDAHLLTIPAQNALLKTLEEPPANAQIFLVTAQPDLLLPTVLSRVQIDRLTSSPVGEIDTADTKKLAEKINKASAGERVGLVDELALTRETALQLLDKFEQLLHQDLNLKINYDLILQTRSYLKANVNVKLAMDNLFFGLFSV